MKLFDYDSQMIIMWQIPTATINYIVLGCLYNDTAVAIVTVE